MDEKELLEMKELKMTLEFAAFIILLMGFDGGNGHTLLDDLLP
jgi:hypothetical protein